MLTTFSSPFTIRRLPPTLRTPDCVWLHDWNFLKFDNTGATDEKGWSYQSLGGTPADTGGAGKAKSKGLLRHRARERVWYRVAGTPVVAQAVQVRPWHDAVVKARWQLTVFVVVAFLE